MNAASLLSDIEEYLVKHNITPASFGIYAMSDPGFYKKLHSDHRFKPSTLASCARWLAANPDGGGIPKRKTSLDALSRAPERINRDTLTYVVRDPCFYCETRRDFGCEHYPLEGRT